MLKDIWLYVCCGATTCITLFMAYLILMLFFT